MSHATPEFLDDGYNHILKQFEVFELVTDVYVTCDPLFRQGWLRAAKPCVFQKPRTPRACSEAK